MRIDNAEVYSQNFLKSSKLANRLIIQSDIAPTDQVLDIGAGKGKLTRELSSFSRKVIAIEKDPKLIKPLRKNICDLKNVQIISKDIFDYNLPSQPYKVFSNIPFNCSAGIIKKLFLSNENSPLSAYLVLQLGFWNKYSGIKRETQVSLLLKPIWEMKPIYIFERWEFNPPPNVDSVFVEIKRRNRPLLSTKEYSSYCDFISYSTTLGKENIGKNLKKLLSHKQLKILSKNLDFDLKLNPLDLDYNQWIEIFKFFYNNVPEYKKKIIKNSYKNQVKKDENKNY